jgi:predicted dehydrogenase
MGRHHARAAAAAGASIVAIVDENREAALALAASWPGAVAETDLAQALGSASARVTHVCTPLATHGGISKTIADAGLHALIEKPLASTAEEARRIHESFTRNGKLACPAHQYAFQRSVRDAAAWLPGAGSLRRIAFDICSAGAANGLDPDAVVAEILPHPLSIAQRLLPSAKIPALDWSCVRPAPGEWVITAPIDGAVLVMQLSMNGRPTRFMTRITADDGSMELDNFHDFAVFWPGTVSRAAKIAQPFLRSGLSLAAASWNLAARAARREFAYPGLQTLVAEFYRAAESRGTLPPPITPEQSIAVAEARDRIFALAAHG